MPKMSVYMVRSAFIYLLVGATFGGLMLANKAILIDPLLVRLLFAHADVMLVGWMIQFAMGIAAWILPRFAHAPKYGSLPLIWGAWVSINLGVLLVIIGYVTVTMPLVLVGRLLEIAAIIAFAIFIVPRIKPFEHVP